MDTVSLFSGAGGLDLGLAATGHELIWANDFDKDSVSTYRKNIGDHVIHAPIEAISSNDIPEAELIVGGFPCQGFSQANLRRTIEDPRNRLYKEFVRVITDKQPLYFLAENVRGISSLGGGSALALIVAGFEAAGYRVAAKVLNAADFGVPQNRYRMIFLGTRIDLPNVADLRHPLPTHSSRPEDGLQPHRTLGECLAAVPDPIKFPLAVPNQQYSRYRVVERDFTGHRATNPDRPSPTILARGNGGGGVNATPHPDGTRRMSVRESAAVQTFPLDFEFEGKLGSAYRQVGNAVAVKFAEALGSAASVAHRQIPSESGRAA
ncbi:DNA cytosine methyltransferase [Marisediminicola sp. LYQ134]|uniref:DNA cytosine methyltransferase n=1 Tax=Marisediminicola sp. LYQ134 TaxID=3391061 RepID=UPI0039831A50